MFYRFNPEYALRGWDDIPYAFIDIESGKVIGKLSEKSFELLQKLHNISVTDEFCQSKKVSDKLVLFRLTGLIECYDEKAILRPEQIYKKYDCRYISEAVWSITNRCNYNCRHCSQSSPDSKEDTDLSLDDCKNVIMQLKECGIGSVTLIGGEPLIHSNFKEIIQELLSNGINISQIFTNGSLLTENLLNYFENNNISPTIRMSFDGVGFHNFQRGIKNAEQNLIKKLEMLKHRKFPVVIDMCVNSSNLDSLKETVSLMDSYDVKLINITPTCDIGLWKDVSDSEKLPFERYYKYLLEYIPEFLKSQSKIALNIYRILYISGDKKSKIFLPKSYAGTQEGVKKLTCPFFKSSINISYDGRINPCFVITDSKYMKENMPSLFQEKLQSILKESKYTQCALTKAEDILKANERCQNCDYKLICGGGCRAMAICQNEDFYGYDISNCIFFRNGYYKKMKKCLRRKYEKNRSNNRRS